MNSKFEKDIQACLTVLNEGGLILYPTDTLWGVGCDATNSTAVQKIIELKKITDYNDMAVLVTEEQEILQYVAAPDMEVFDYLATTDRPTTVIYQGAIGLADPLVAEDGSVGIRICQDSFCRQLIKRFHRPIVATPANYPTQALPTRFNLINLTIKECVDYIVHWRQEEEAEGIPDSIIRWREGMIEVVRT